MSEAVYETVTVGLLVEVRAIVANDVSQPGIGFESADNAVVMISRDGRERSVGPTSKLEVARAILDEVARLRASVVLQSESR